VRGGDPGGHGRDRLDREQGRALARGIEQHPRGAGVGRDTHEARGREALGVPPVRISDQHQAGFPLRALPSGDRQAARPYLARDPGKAHFDERDADRHHGGHHSRQRFLTRGIAQCGAERSRVRDRGPDGREPVQGHGAQRTAPGVLGVDHVRTTRDRGARFDGPPDAHQQTHFRALPCGYRETAGRLGFRRRDVKTTIE